MANGIGRPFACSFVRRLVGWEIKFFSRWNSWIWWGIDFFLSTNSPHSDTWGDICCSSWRWRAKNLGFARDDTSVPNRSVCDLVLQSFTGCKITKVVSLTSGFDFPNGSACPFSGPALARFLTQSTDSPEIKLKL
jgi:hypothetical protein